MDEVIHTLMPWIGFSLPIWMSPLAALIWVGWTYRPWVHFVVINLLPFFITYAIIGDYGLVAMVFVGWPLLVLGWLVSAISLFREASVKQG